jgi:hypothetical protein
LSHSTFTLSFVITDFPEDTKFPTEAEKKFVRDRLHEDVGDSVLETKMTVKDVLNVFKDYKVFVGGFMYFGLVVPAYGYAYFAPTIVRQLGYSRKFRIYLSSVSRPSY